MDIIITIGLTCVIVYLFLGVTAKEDYNTILHGLPIEDYSSKE